MTSIKQTTGKQQDQNKQTTSRQQADNNTIRSKELKEGEELKKKDNSQQAGRFTPPSVIQVDEYMQSICKGSYTEAEKFVNFYESKGWLVGKAKMKNWQAAVRNWVKSDSQKPAGKKSFELQDAKNFIEGF